MNKGSLATLLAAVMVTSVLSAVPVGAQETPPETQAPFACAESFIDPSGDVEAENLDVTGGGIAAVDDSSFTVELQVVNLSTELPTLDSTGLVWYFLWTFADVTYFANANYSIWTDEVAYSLGTLGTSFTTTAATEGTFTEGENGTITVVVPFEEVGSPVPGDVLTQIYADTRTRLSGPAGPGLVSPWDRGPDGEAYGEDYTLGTCAADDAVEAAPEDDEPKKDCKKIKDKKKRKKCKKQQ